MSCVPGEDGGSGAGFPGTGAPSPEAGLWRRVFGIEAPWVFSLGKESYPGAVTTGRQSRARAQGPVSKVEGHARAKPDSVRPAHPLLVPKSLQGLTGTPLVAGSPIRHESALQGSAVEVQTYQPPWKTLSEFALQSDLDQPAFQQLVRP